MDVPFSTDRTVQKKKQLPPNNCLKTGLEIRTIKRKGRGSIEPGRESGNPFTIPSSQSQCPNNIWKAVWGLSTLQWFALYSCFK